MYRIKSVREVQNIAQTKLAAMAGVSQPYLHDLENGKRGAKEETLQRIAQVLGVTVQDLKGDDDETSDN